MEIDWFELSWVDGVAKRRHRLHFRWVLSRRLFSGKSYRMYEVPIG